MKIYTMNNLLLTILGLSALHIAVGPFGVLGQGMEIKWSSYGTNVDGDYRMFSNGVDMGPIKGLDHFDSLRNMLMGPDMNSATHGGILGLNSPKTTNSDANNPLDVLETLRKMIANQEDGTKSSSSGNEPSDVIETLRKMILEKQKGKGEESSKTQSEMLSTLEMLRKMLLEKQGTTHNAGNKETDELANLRKMILDKHNEYRAKHGAEPLVLDEELNRSSQKHAEHCVGSNMIQHSNHMGENIYHSASSDPNYKFPPTEPVEDWYNEIKSCDYNPSGFCIGTSGHFTQVVWKSSKKLGVGIATRGSSRCVVCQYDPPGNNLGQFAANVSPPK